MRNKVRSFVLIVSAALVLCSFALRGRDAFAMDTLSGDPETVRTFIATISENLIQGNSQIALSDFNITPRQLTDYMQSVMNYDPYLFLTTGSYKYYTAGDKVTRVEFSYVYDKDGIGPAISEFRDAVNGCVRGIHEDWPDEAKLLYVCDYLSGHFVYDYEKMVSDAYGLAKYGKGVCQAFTLFADSVLEELGIEYDTVFSRNINHIWNRVSIGGEWYNIDFTWANLSTPGNVLHVYFLRSDENGGEPTYFKTKHSSEGLDCDWRSSVSDGDSSPEDRYFNNGALWFDDSTRSAFVYADGGWYYCSCSGADIELRRTDDLYSYEVVDRVQNKRFYANDEGTSFYPGYWGGIKASGRYVIYTAADEVFAFDTLAGTSESIYTYEGGNNIRIYGMRDPGDTLELIIRKAPPNGGDEVDFVENLSLELPSFCVMPQESKELLNVIRFISGPSEGANILSGITPGSSAGVLMSAAGGTAAREDGEAMTEDETVGTGTKLIYSNKEYTVFVPGDVDGDGYFTDPDAVYLARAALNPDYFPTAFDFDFDGSGSVDTGDAVYLLKGIEFPDDYPVNLW